MAATTLTASGDNWLEEYNPTTNHSTDAVMDNIGCHGGSNTIWNNAIAKFDVSSIRPCTINSGSFKVYKLGGYWDAAVTSVKIQGYQLRRADMSIVQSCWNNYKTGSAWSTGGAQNTTSDRFSTKIWADKIETAWFGVVEYTITLNATGIAMVQAWVDSESDNAGLLWEVQVNAGTILASYLDFASINHGTYHGPQLYLDYTATAALETAKLGGLLHGKINHNINIL